MLPKAPLPASIGRFRIDALVGAGGMGEVYKAFDPTLQRVVALKTVRSDIDNPEYFARLYREAQACARLRHPNVVTVYEAGEADALVYLVMEFLQGEDLRALLRRGALTMLEKIDVLVQVLAALHHTHAEGVIHRDIKPSNVHRGPDGTIKLVDFGLAQVALASPLTRTGVALCTPEYASPEQLRDQTLDGRTDVYSAGALAYEMLTGRPAFSSTASSSVAALIYKAVTEPPPPMDVSWSRAFPELERIVTTAMAKMPDERYQTAGEMREALLAFLATSRDALAAEQARLEDDSRGAVREAQTLILEGKSDAAQTLLETTVGINPDARAARTLLEHTRRANTPRAATAVTYVGPPAPTPAVPPLTVAPAPETAPAAPAAPSLATPPTASAITPASAATAAASLPLHSISGGSQTTPPSVADDRVDPELQTGGPRWWWAAGLAVASVVAWLLLVPSTTTTTTAADATTTPPVVVPGDSSGTPPGTTEPTTPPATATATPADARTTPTPPSGTTTPGRDARAAGTTSPLTGTTPANGATATTRPETTAADPPSAKELFAARPGDASAVSPGLRFRLTRLGTDGVEGDVDPAATTFHSGDRVRFTFESNVDGYLYVVQQGSSGRWTVLFPGPNINGGKNAIGRAQRYEVPNGDWFLFDENPGTEQVFVFLSREPMQQLPGFDRPVTRNETVVASVVDDLKRRVQSRDLVFEKDRPSAAPGGAVQATYVVNKAEVANAVAASIALVHAR